MAHNNFRRGCLAGNLGQEMGVLPERFRQWTPGVFTDWEARTTNCLRAAQATGQISQGADCDRLAAFFWIGWEGAVRAKLERKPDGPDAFADCFFDLLGTRADTNDRCPMFKVIMISKDETGRHVVLADIGKQQLLEGDVTVRVQAYAQQSQLNAFSLRATGSK